MVAMVGIEPTLGTPRFTFGIPELYDGVNIVIVCMGVFGIGEILSNAERRDYRIFDVRLKGLVVRRDEVGTCFGAIMRGSGIGFILGLIPGVGLIVPTFLSYIAEKKLSAEPHTFGKGAIAGVAGPETANNAGANASFIPLLTLGIPSSSTTAILVGALVMHGLTPGPLLFRDHPDFVWAVIASMYVGNAMLLVLNLPLIPLWTALLRIPYSLLLALIMALIVIGAYSLTNSVFSVGLAMLFGLVGYAFRKLDIPAAPMVMTLVLTPVLERTLRQSLELSGGDFSIFFTRPISVAFLAAGALVIANAAFGVISGVFREGPTE
jgi:putative tricarboxylic transport membrane protein